MPDVHLLGWVLQKEKAAGFFQKVAPQKEGIMPVLSCHSLGVRALPQDARKLGSVLLLHL